MNCRYTYFPNVFLKNVNFGLECCIGRECWRVYLQILIWNINNKFKVNCFEKLELWNIVLC